MTPVVYKKEIKVLTKEFAFEIIRFYKNLRKRKMEFVLPNQLLRSGTSIGANVIEAKSSSSRKELIRYYEIALKSANETEYWIELAKEMYQISVEATKILEDLTQIRNIIASIVIKLKSSA